MKHYDEEYVDIIRNQRDRYEEQVEQLKQRISELEKALELACGEISDFSLLKPYCPFYVMHINDIIDYFKTKAKENLNNESDK